MVSIALTAQDTVRRSDPWYFIETHDTLVWNGCELNPLYNFWYYYPLCILPEYGNIALIKPWPDLNSSLYLYGIALTAYNFPEDTGRHKMSPIIGLHRTKGPYTSTVSHLQLFDSLTGDNSIKKCWFEYDAMSEPPYTGGSSKPHTEVVPVTEFYFDTPYSFEALPDTLFTSLFWEFQRRQRYLKWVADNCPTADTDSFRFYPVKGQSFNVLTTFVDIQNDFYQNALFYNYAQPLFGPLFLILNLRCSAPYLHLASRGDNTATITWSQAESGEYCQVSLTTYGGSPDLGQVITSIDTFYTFDSLIADTIYQAWVRKACRYTTGGYDTLVWSDWSRPLTFRPAMGIDEVDDYRLQIACHDGCISVKGLPAGECAEVYDIKGYRVASLATDGLTPPLPQGVYIVSTTRGRLRKVVLLRQ